MSTHMITRMHTILKRRTDTHTLLIPPLPKIRENRHRPKSCLEMIQLPGVVVVFRPIGAGLDSQGPCFCVDMYVPCVCRFYSVCCVCLCEYECVSVL
jgi:hypothetical protein